jgi:hypothetical protein
MEDGLPSLSRVAGFQPAEPEGRQDAGLPSQAGSLTSGPQHVVWKSPPTGSLTASLL